MIKLIDRYVFREVAAPTLLGLLVWTSIFIVNNFFKLADQWVKGTLTMLDVGRTLVYYLPSVLAMTLPMSVLLGVLIGFSRLSADSEITALRTTGVSYFRLLAPTLALATLAWGATTAIYMRAVPWANTRAVELTSAALQRADINREIKPGTWVSLSESIPGRDMAVFARGVDDRDPARAWLTDVDILSVDRQTNEARHHHATRARIERVMTGEETGRLKFRFEGLRSVFWKPVGDDPSPTLQESSSGEQLLQEQAMAGSRPPASQRRITKSVRLQTIPELRQTLEDLAEMDRIEALRATDPQQAARLQAASRVPIVPQVRERTRRLAQMEIHKKFAIPIACLVFALVGMPLGTSTRRGGKPASFAVSLAVIILWWAIYNAGETWCLAGRLSPASGAWLPDLVIAVVGVHALFAQRHHQAVGLYRLVRQGSLLASMVLALLTAVFAFERHEAAAAGRAVPALPAWAPALAVALFLVYQIVVRFRDPIARALADLSEAFRQPRPRAPASDSPETEVGPGMAADLTPPPAPVEPGAKETRREDRRWRRRGRLERVRGALVTALLALVVFSAVDAFQHADGPLVAGREMLVSWQSGAFVILGCAILLLQASGVRIFSTIDWWVLTTLGRAFALVLGSMVTLYFVFHYLELADTILQNRVGARVVLDYFLHLVPRMFVDTVPYAAMVAVLVTFGVMAKFNELTAVRCGGVSVWRMVMPAVLCALLLSCVAFVVHDYVLPRANQRCDDLKRQMQGAPPVRRANMRGFLMSSDQAGIYQFRSVVTHEVAGQTRSQITGLTVLRKSESGRLIGIDSATDATWADGEWLLRNGWQARVDDARTVTVTPFTQKLVSDLDRPEYFAAVRRDPQEMTFSEFKRHAEEQAAAGNTTAPLQVGLHQKIALPAGTLILVLIGLPFAFTTGRRGALYGVGIALILGVVYKAAVAFFVAMGAAGYLPPVAAAWAPNILFGLAGVTFLLHVRT